MKAEYDFMNSAEASHYIYIECETCGATIENSTGLCAECRMNGELFDEVRQS